MNSWQAAWDIYRALPMDIKMEVSTQFISTRDSSAYNHKKSAQLMYEALIFCGVIKPRATTDDGAEEYEAIMAADEIMGERSAGS